MAAAGEGSENAARVMRGSDPNVIIIGAGIGGLTAALELHRIGIKAHIYESVEKIKPLGVGINLLPHATKVLGECGLINALAATAIATRELVYFNKFGQKIWSEPRGIEAGYHWPQLSIHRGDLQRILLDAVRERLGDECIHTGHHLAQIGPSSDERIYARFVDRTTGSIVTAVLAELIIAADGIHSAARAELRPSEGPPIWNGIVLWRAVTEAPPILSGREMVSIGYPGHRFVAYPISQAHAARGASLINWIVEIGRDPNTPFRREDWNRRGNLDEFLPRFESWVFDWLDVPAIMRAADAIYEYPCVDRDPLRRWTHGRVTLLGDAAHPMYPMGSNGASQAILDARALAQALASAPDIDQALVTYEAERRPATARVVLANRQQGPSEVQTIVEQRAPNGFVAIEAVVSAAELLDISERYKQLAGFDQSTVNTLSPRSRP
jgi:2-polyprenyl-6-methoxyphenol hydroxylase-like FAD-dependent oxidoreductase